MAIEKVGMIANRSSTAALFFGQMEFLKPVVTCHLLTRIIGSE